MEQKVMQAQQHRRHVKQVNIHRGVAWCYHVNDSACAQTGMDLAHAPYLSARVLEVRDKR